MKNLGNLILLSNRFALNQFIVLYQFSSTTSASVNSNPFDFLGTKFLALIVRFAVFLSVER